MRWGTLVVGAALLGAVAGCGGGGEAAEQVASNAPVIVSGPDLAVARYDEVGSGVMLTGALAPDELVSVKAQVPGIIRGLRLEQGDRVRVGQVLGTIEAQGVVSQAIGAQAAVAAAEANLAIARRDQEAARTLFSAGALAELDFRRTQTAVEAATAQLAAARAQAAGASESARRTTVVSPLTGTVAERLASEGEAVSPGQPLLSVVDPSRMRLEASVPAPQLNLLRVGGRVDFQVQGYPNQRFTGLIERIAPVADPATRQVQVHVTVPNNGGNLVAGLFAEGRVESNSRDALTVPATALDPNAGSPSVTRVRGGRAERVAVTLGVRDPRADKIEVVSGLQPGDTVLIGAARVVAPGTPVRVSTVGATASR